MINMRAIIDRNLTIVAAYYRMFSGDATWSGSISIDPGRINALAFASFGAILNEIRRHVRNGETKFLLACHGNPHGLPYRLTAHAATTANADLLDELRRAATGDREQRGQLLTAVDTRNQRIFRSEQQLDDLLDAIREIRAGKIEHIEFRACNIGAGPALQAINDLLGAGMTVAPKVLFIWTNIRTATVSGSPQYLQQQISRLGPTRRIFSRDDCLMPASTTVSGSDPALAMGATIDPNDRPTNARFFALGADAILGWTQSYFDPSLSWMYGRQPAGGGYRRRGELPIIGFWNPTNVDYPFVFAGDGMHYLEHLEVVH